MQCQTTIIDIEKDDIYKCKNNAYRIVKINTIKKTRLWVCKIHKKRYHSHIKLLRTRLLDFKWN